MNKKNIKKVEKWCKRPVGTLICRYLHTHNVIIIIENHGQRVSTMKTSKSTTKERPQEQPLEDLKVVQLKALLKERGLPVSGRKRPKAKILATQ